MIITIDGPSGTGKSTVARGLASTLGYLYFDTGAMYRALTFLALKNDTDLADSNQVARLLKNFDYHVRDGRYFVGSEDLTEAIRTPSVTGHVSAVAALSQVRQAMVEIQQAQPATPGVVFEGRDMGTVVFPRADMKFYLDARAEVRAHRRYEQIRLDHPELTEEAILVDQKRRDHLDSTRTHSPLRPAEDAIHVDTSDHTAQEVIEQLCTYVKEKH